MTMAQTMRVTGRADAEQLVAGVLANMTDLEALLEAETAHVRVGRFREGLSQEFRKNELTASYIQGLEAIKAALKSGAGVIPETALGERIMP